MKRLKNIECKNEQQLDNQLELVKNNNAERESLNRLKFLGNMNQNAKEKYNEIKKIDSENNYDELVCAHTNGKVYNFTKFKRLRNLPRNLYYGDITIEQGKSRQDEMEVLLSERLLMHLKMVFSDYQNFSMKNSQKIDCQKA